MQIVESQELASFKKLQSDPEKQILEQIEKSKEDLQNLQNKIKQLKKHESNQTKTDIHKELISLQDKFKDLKRSNLDLQKELADKTNQVSIL